MARLCCRRRRGAASLGTATATDAADARAPTAEATAVAMPSKYTYYYGVLLESLSAGFAIRCCCYNSRGPPPTTMVAPTVTL